MTRLTSDFWNERYGAESDYVYGTEPNDFLRDEAARIPAGGRVLCLAEGEGRNAVWLASRGFAVTAVDWSAEGLKKAARMAADRGVSVDLVQADLGVFDLGTGWSAIVAIWAHVPPAIRARVHGALGSALAPGGVFILESYRPEQIPLGTGGPKDVTLLPTLAQLRTELAGLDLVVARDADREIHEGPGHGGPSATVQVVAIRR